jgi:DNA-binding CsgD family transcriptional regulator
MTRKESRTGTPSDAKRIDRGRQQAAKREPELWSSERARAANEVGSAIAHQLSGPLTALRLYVGEIRESSRSRATSGAPDGMLQMVEGAFVETERVCAMMRLISDDFEGPLHPETATSLGRDVICWWSQRTGAEDGDVVNRRRPVASQSILALLTPRQREVLGHISQGCSNKQGAVRMQIGPRTFESHRARIMRKLGAKNAADLVRMVLGGTPVTP